MATDFMLYLIEPASRCHFRNVRFGLWIQPVDATHCLLVCLARVYFCRISTCHLWLVAIKAVRSDCFGRLLSSAKGRYGPTTDGHERQAGGRFAALLGCARGTVSVGSPAPLPANTSCPQSPVRPESPSPCPSDWDGEPAVYLPGRSATQRSPSWEYAVPVRGLGRLRGKSGSVEDPAAPG